MNSNFMVHSYKQQTILTTQNLPRNGGNGGCIGNGGCGRGGGGEDCAGGCGVIGGGVTNSPSSASPEKCNIYIGFKY